MLMLMLAVAALTAAATAAATSLEGSRDYEPIWIPADGGDLAAYLSTGGESRTLWVIFVHGNREVGQAHLLYQRLQANIDPEISVLALDLRGFGQSEPGELPAEEPILNRTQDIEAAVRYLAASRGVPESRIVLMGHSLGALQVLKAAKGRAFAAVIGVGPSNFEGFLQNDLRSRRYLDKFERNSELPLSMDQLLIEGKSFTPEALFTPCPTTPVTLIYGWLEVPLRMREFGAAIPDACADQLAWELVPLADHMYGTEFGLLPSPINSLLYAIPLRGLIERVNDRLRLIVGSDRLSRMGGADPTIPLPVHPRISAAVVPDLTAHQAAQSYTLGTLHT